MVGGATPKGVAPFGPCVREVSRSHGSSDNGSMSLTLFAVSNIVAVGVP